MPILEVKSCWHQDLEWVQIYRNIDYILVFDKGKFIFAFVIFLSS